jgi:phage terminase large subunit
MWEFKNYKYKVDNKSGQITDKIVDNFNHHIDAIRYSLEPMMKGNVINYNNLV